jgi:hypothetical protein
MKKYKVKYDRSAYLLVLPYIIFFLMFVAYPLVFSLILVFHRWDIVTPMQWVGLKNFERLIVDPLFFKSDTHSITDCCCAWFRIAAELEDKIPLSIQDNLFSAGCSVGSCRYDLVAAIVFF